jgi:hypothetical protein
MAQNWKPVIEELKTKFANRDEIRLTVQKTLKTVAEEAKESRLANEYVFPALESEKADNALNFLSERLSTTPLAKYDLVSKINVARKAILNLKPQQSAAPETTSEPSTPSDLAAEAKTAAAAFETEPKTKKKPKSADTLEE